MKKKQTGVILMLAALSLMSIQPVEACTRAVYLGPVSYTHLDVYKRQEYGRV